MLFLLADEKRFLVNGMNASVSLCPFTVSSSRSRMMMQISLSSFFFVCRGKLAKKVISSSICQWKMMWLHPQSISFPNPVGTWRRTFSHTRSQIYAHYTIAMWLHASMRSTPKRKSIVSFLFLIMRGRKACLFAVLLVTMCWQLTYSRLGVNDLGGENSVFTWTWNFSKPNSWSRCFLESHK